ncbi:MAG: PHP domain-containing protein [candidate division WOR-3 bacterium]|nr:MAG: PHP domain-containing protein [candidate division WOR-3 bacterium]
MLQCFHADLHVHTCLSPCADIIMSPLRIVQRSKKLKLDIIGICDHNSAENAAATIRAAEHSSVTVLPGMEIASAEEVHVLALFEKTDDVLAMQGFVYQHLPNTSNDPHLFGEQVIANEFDDFLGFHERMLMTATDIPLHTLVQKVHKYNGIAIASHADRPSFGLYGQLGFVPPDLELDAMELSPHISYEQAIIQFPDMIQFPVISSSDAHHLDDIGKNEIQLWLAEPTFSEIQKALKKEDGRKIEEQKRAHED